MYMKRNECAPLLRELRPWGRKYGAGVCAQRETNSQRAEEEQNSKEDKRWAKLQEKKQHGSERDL